jgi:hypothetical protein
MNTCISVLVVKPGKSPILLEIINSELEMQRLLEVKNIIIF